MKKPRIVIVDENYNYILPILMSLAEANYAKVDIEVITDKTFFANFFAIPQSIDILIISESMYDDSIGKHDIRHGFIMSEVDVGVSTDKGFICIYKYSNLKTIFSAIQSEAGELFIDSADYKKAPQLILVTSALGGTGKTTIAIGISSSLAKNMKRVLYVNSDYLHTFQRFISDVTPLEDNRLYLQLASNPEESFTLIKNMIRTTMIFLLISLLITRTIRRTKA